MDTDELSSEAYHAIIIEAEKFNHDLTLQFGVLASSCDNEKEYLHQAKEMIKKLEKIDESSLSIIFFDTFPEKIYFLICLQKILANISEVEKIPEAKRYYEFFTPNFATGKFNKISIDNFLEKYKLSNPKEDITKLKKSIIEFRKLKAAGVKCNCGGSLWIIGSAISGKGCFTCITGESDCSNDYDIK